MLAAVDDLDADVFIRHMIGNARRDSQVEFATALLIQIAPLPNPIQDCGRPLWTAADLR